MQEPPRSPLSSQERVTVLLMSIVYLVGAAGHLWEATLPLMLQMTPWVLLFLGIVAFSPVILERRWKVVVWAVAVYLLTLGLEILGVKTGMVFGSYQYGEILGFSLLGTPLVIGFNWVLVVLGTILISNRLFANRYVSSVCAGALCVAFDYVLEPLAISPVFDYWQWAQGDVPLQNYVAWFVIALAAAMAFNYYRLDVRSLIPRAYIVIQLIFFALLRLLMGI